MQSLQFGGTRGRPPLRVLRRVTGFVGGLVEDPSIYGSSIGDLVGTLETHSAIMLVFLHLVSHLKNTSYLLRGLTQHKF